MKRLTIFFLALAAGHGMAAETYGTAVVAEVVSIYDADTFRVNVDGWPAVVGTNMPVRVAGVDAPEIAGKCEAEKDAAQRAKAFTVQRLREAKVIELRDIQRGKYFRLLADVHVDGASLGAALIEAGHARPYDGGKRGGWCGQ